MDGQWLADGQPAAGFMVQFSVSGRHRAAMASGLHGWWTEWDENRRVIHGYPWLSGDIPWLSGDIPCYPPGQQARAVRGFGMMMFPSQLMDFVRGGQVLGPSLERCRGCVEASRFTKEYAAVHADLRLCCIYVQIYCRSKYVCISCSNSPRTDRNHIVTCVSSQHHSDCWISTVRYCKTWSTSFVERFFVGFRHPTYHLIKLISFRKQQDQQQSISAMLPLIFLMCCKYYTPWHVSDHPCGFTRNVGLTISHRRGVNSRCSWVGWIISHVFFKAWVCWQSWFTVIKSIEDIIADSIC